MHVTHSALITFIQFVTPTPFPPYRSTGASKLGSPLMGLFFATIGATCVAEGVSAAALAPFAAFVGIM